MLMEFAGKSLLDKARERQKQRPDLVRRCSTRSQRYREHPEKKAIRQM